MQAGRSDVVVQGLQRHRMVPPGKLQLFVGQGSIGGLPGDDGFRGPLFEVIVGHGTAAFYWKLNAAECRST
ncbi:hypothetical protein StoSoilB3_37870 [Arthrobacter sp. StoSoilB3]|nr:hypothetical protein StoSoilB3_37870 [Arthrobacter sp. StoSoilB3]